MYIYIHTHTHTYCIYIYIYMQKPGEDQAAGEQAHQAAALDDSALGDIHIYIYI